MRRLSHQNDEWIDRRPARHDRGLHRHGQGRHRGARPDRQAGRPMPPAASIPRCCASTAVRTGRTSTPSTSNASCSPPTATSSWRSTIAAATAAASAYQKAIFADWGNKEVVDLLGAMDHVEKIGLADPGSARHRRLELRRHPDQLYHCHRRPLQGGDQRRRQLESDLDVRHRHVHQPVRAGARAALEERRTCGSSCRTRSSTPTGFSTPTLFMGGEKDFNVPLLGSEQMYQALRSLGVDAKLVIYPEPVPRHHHAQLQEGPVRALPGLVRASTCSTTAATTTAGR